VNLNFNIRVWNTNLNHRMGRDMTTRCTSIERLICFALLAEIEIGTNSAFKSDSTNVKFVVFASSSIAVNMIMYQIDTRDKMVEGKREMIVYFCEDMLRVNCSRTLNAFFTKVVIATSKAFVSDSHNVLLLEG